MKVKMDHDLGEDLPTKIDRHISLDKFEQDSGQKGSPLVRIAYLGMCRDSVEIRLVPWTY